MKKHLLLTGISTVLLSAVSYGEINLRENYNGSTLWGYNGLEIRSNFSNVSLKTNDETKIYDLKNLSIRNNLEQLTNYLETENKDTENLFSLGYSGFNSSSYKNNGYSILLGKANSNNNRIGLKFNFIDGYYKEDNNKLKEKDYNGALFYSSKNLNLITYLGKAETKENKESSKNLYYGVYGKWKKELSSYSYYFETFEYLEPSIYFDTQLQRFTTKDSLNKKHNDSANSTIGIELKNSLDFDEFKLTTTLDIGYNREFLENKKYNSFKVKEKSLDNLTARIQMNLKYSESTDIFIGYSTKKSLNNANYSNKGTVGFTFRF